jgi:hypothetical protein
MAFWTNATLQDPKRKYRFLVRLLAYDGAATWYAKTVTKPKFSISETSHSYLNHKFHYPGRVEWDTIDVTLVDPVSPDAIANTISIIQRAGYHPPTDANDMSTMSKVAAVSALKGVIIEQINSKGKSVETWTLKNAFITSVDTQDLSYDADELSEISLTIRYDWAELEAGGKRYFAGA